jgi:amino acid transporter
MTDLRRKDEAGISGHNPNRLARGLHLPEVLMQCIAGMAPAATIVFTIQFIAQFAGVAVPATLLIALLIMVSLAYSLSQIAKELPSAGGYYTFVRTAIGPRAGMAVASVVFIWILAPSMNTGFLSTVLQSQVKQAYGINVRWELYFVAIILVTGWLAYRGIAVSGKALLILGALEIGVLVIIGAFGFASPGAGGVTLQALTPVAAHGGIYLAVVFSLFFYAGWEGGAPIAEESQDPKRTMPRALVGSVLGVGSVFVFCAWGVMSGWGSNDAAGFAKAADSPLITLAHHYWGPAWVFMLFALFSSVCAIALASILLVTRMFYAMSRVGVFPQFLSKLHPTHKTPVWATRLSIMFSLAFGLITGESLGPVTTFYIYGLTFTLLIILVYIAGNLAVYRYFRKQAAGRFMAFPHAILPAVTSAFMLYVGYKSLVPFPAYPVAAGVWVAIAWVVAAFIWIAVSRGRTTGLDTVLIDGVPLTDEGETIV